MKHKIFTLLFTLAASVGTIFSYDEPCSGMCGSDLEWTIANPDICHVQITGTGSMWNYTLDNVPTYRYCNCNLAAVSLPVGLVNIGDFAFANLTNCNEIIIPASVQFIGKGAFMNSANTSIYFAGSNIQLVKDSAFYGCKNIIGTSGLIKDSVCNATFYGSNLSISSIPSYVKWIGDYAFAKTACGPSLTIHEKIKHIGDSAFHDCPNLTSITINSQAFLGEDYSVYHNMQSIFGEHVKHYTIGNDIKRIGESAFYNCTNLESVEIGENLESMGYGCFNECSSLQSVEWNAVNCADFDGVEMGYGTARPFNYQVSVSNITFGEKVKHIPAHLMRQQGIEELIIPDSVTSIGEWAFYRCVLLKNIVIGSSVNNIGSNAFYGCSGLTSITCRAITPPICDGFSVFYNVNKSIPLYVPLESVTAYKTANEWKDFSNILPIEEDPEENVLASGTFGAEGDNLTWKLTEDSALTISGTGAMSEYYLESPWEEYNSIIRTITIKNGVTSIGGAVFYECNMMSVTIPKSVTKIGYAAFSGCSNLTSIELPSSVTSIDRFAFEACSGLTSINVSDENTVYDSRENCNAIIETATNTLIVGCKNTIIPNSITSIGESAFSDRFGLNSIEIPNSVISIGDYAFSGCYRMMSVTIGNSVSSIGQYAFYGCYNLKGVNIPSSVTILGQNAFGGMGALFVINNYATTPQNITDDVFHVDKSACFLYVPEESVEAYQTAEVWKEFTHVNVNFAPYNLQATPDTGRVTVSWGVENEADSYLVTIYHNDEVWASNRTGANTHELSFTINSDSAMTFTWSVAANIIYNAYTYNISTVYGEPFTVEPSPYTPRNLQATPNGDGTYTITWDPIESEGVYNYEVYILGNTLSYQYSSSTNSCKTGILPYAGEYTYYVTVYDYDMYNALGYASSTFTIEATEPRDIIVRVLVQPNSSCDTTSGVTFGFYNSETRQIEKVAANSEGDGWYSYTFAAIIDPILQFKFFRMYRAQNHPVPVWIQNECMVTKDTCLEFTANDKLRYVDCDAVARNYQPYNLQAEPSPGKVTLSWEVTDVADEYNIALLDSSGNIIMNNWIYGNVHTESYYLGNDSTLTVAQWYVRPYVSSQGGTLSNATAYGEPFEVAPSPFNPQNLQAIPNGDGTFTITWDAIDNEEVRGYRVILSSAAYNYYSNLTETNSYVTPVLPVAGDYIYFIITINTNELNIGSSSAVLTVNPVEEHDITVRVLIQPYSGYDVSNGVQFEYYDVETGGYLATDATVEGNGWYNHTFTTTNPGLQFRLMGGQGTDVTIVSDTCLEYSGTLNGVDCNAEIATEFDITVTSYNCYAYGYSTYMPNSIGYELTCGNSGFFYFKFILPMDQDDIQLGIVYTDSIDTGNSYGYYRPNNSPSSSYITYDSVSFIKTIDTDSIEYMEAVIVSTYGVTYRLHYKHDLHYLKGDAEDNDCLFEFNEYNEDVQNTDSLTYIFVAADNYNKSDYEYIALRFVVPEGTTSLPIGSYVISNSLDTMTVWAGYRTISGDFGGSATYYNNYDSGNRYYWYMVSGIVTVDAEKNISVAALNSYGRTISCYLHGNKTTDIESINTYPSGETESARKILRDGQIFILRGEKVYTIQGQEVK